MIELFAFRWFNLEAIVSELLNFYYDFKAPTLTRVHCVDLRAWKIPRVITFEKTEKRLFHLDILSAAKIWVCYFLFWNYSKDPWQNLLQNFLHCPLLRVLCFFSSNLQLPEISIEIRLKSFTEILPPFSPKLLSSVLDSSIFERSYYVPSRWSKGNA